MTDDRNYVRAKIAEFDSEIEMLKKQQQRYLTVLSVFDEIDSHDLHEEIANVRSSQPKIKPGTVYGTILEVLESSGPLTTREVYDLVKPKRETVTPKSVSTALYRLLKRGEVVREENRWKIAGAPTDSSEH